MEPSDFPPLADISELRIDPALPGTERLRIFSEATGDPHRFRVGATPVTVVYSDAAPGLQQLLTDLCRRPQ